MYRGEGSYLHSQYLIAIKEEPTAAGFVLEASAQTSGVLQATYPNQASEAMSLQDKKTALENLPFDTGVLQLEPCIPNFPSNIVKRAWGGRK